MGGRGAGKTRAGAEWVRRQIYEHGKKRIALVGPTLSDVREVMIEGPSGLRNIGAPDERPQYSPSRRRLEWPNGAEGFVFSAEDPDSLRGPQFDAAWGDEIGAWHRASTSWDMLMFGLRLGDNPRICATTTPRPTPLIRKLVSSENVVVTRASTLENAHNLAPSFLEAVQASYGGTRLGRQEIDGELIDDPQGALWVRSQIDTYRTVKKMDEIQRIVVAIDPPASNGAKADMCGIVAVGQLAERKGVVLADASVQGLRPLDWAARAVSLAQELAGECGSVEIIAEANQGGEMVRDVLEMAGCTSPVRLVHARLNKRARAGPVAALYAQGKMAHAGSFPALEDQMCVFGSDAANGSPDRVDALVWAVTVLLLEKVKLPPRIRWV
ncbi:DNA-packaging protein [Hirschia litorea]|uniref:DNA-packaging protein n=1 Tax=Hirschia litorea TaxID=1199156 RepID=A0ABW2IIW4_9PROT